MTTTHILQDSDLPFTERLSLREHVLAWIARDIGLHNFIFPPSAPQEIALTPQQRHAFTIHIVNSYLTAPSEAGSQAVARTLVRATSAHLRHATSLLRRNQVTHRHVATYAILLESLWDDINAEMSDGKWALCSMHFDTAVVALRIVYLVLYLRQEVPSTTHSNTVRVAVFRRLLGAWFEPDAPTDEPHADKHSSNFRDLLYAWHLELKSYAFDPASLDKCLEGLLKVQGLVHAADIIDHFLREAAVNDGWLLEAHQLKEDFDSGMLVRRAAKRRTIASPAKRDEVDLEVLDEEPSSTDEPNTDATRNDPSSAVRSGAASSQRRDGDEDWNMNDAGREDSQDDDHYSPSDDASRRRETERRGRKRGGFNSAAQRTRRSPRTSPGDMRRETVSRRTRAVSRADHVQEVEGIRKRELKSGRRRGNGALKGRDVASRVEFDNMMKVQEALHLDADEEDARTPVVYDSATTVAPTREEEEMMTVDVEGQVEEDEQVEVIAEEAEVEEELLIVTPARKRPGRPFGSKNKVRKSPLLNTRLRGASGSDRGTPSLEGNSVSTRPRRGRLVKMTLDKDSDDEEGNDDEAVTKGLDDATVQLEGPPTQEL